MSHSNAEYDIIFAGGGTSACVTAGRLAQADPSLKILIVEAGPHTLNDVSHIQPGRFFSHLTPTSKTMKFIVANPQTVPEGRTVVVTAGQCLGGGSSINFTMYNRAAASEFDEWEVKFKNAGWGSEHLIPLLKKSETYEIDPNAETHGSSGPLHVSWGSSPTSIGTDFLNVAAAYDKDRGSTEDGNDMHNVNSYARWPKYIDGKTGRRSDVAHGYVYTQQDNKNLTVLTGYLVKRIIVENNRAVGIEYVPNPQIHPDEPSTPIISRVKKHIVLSSGSWGSPAILERSGIGAASVLRKFGIQQIVDLPGVGERYQDHLVLNCNFYASDETATMDAIAKGDPAEIEKWHNQWLKDGTGWLGSNAMDAGIKYRPTEEQLKTIGPKFKAKWDALYANVPDKAPMWLGSASLLFGDFPTAPGKKCFGVGYILNHPSQIGSTHITSAEDPAAPHDYNPGDIFDEADMEFHVFAYKVLREFGRRMACFRGEHEAQVPAFPSGSAASLAGVTSPTPADAPDIKYTEEDNKAIVEFIRKFVSLGMHAVGTCAMIPREQGGVVDSRLNVYGVEGLKVADLSIAPKNVGANTYSTAVVIGEKAALILAEDLGIVGV